jgi:hypothetical protein
MNEGKDLSREESGAVATYRPMPDDLIDRIAREIALEVGMCLETFYPDACRAVAWQSCKRAIQGVVRNRMESAGRAAEAGVAEEWLETTRRHRREAKVGWRKAGVGIHADRPIKARADRRPAATGDEG